MTTSDGNYTLINKKKKMFFMFINKNSYYESISFYYKV